MAQARIGLGPGEYEAATTLLHAALDKAREQGASTRGEGCRGRRRMGSVGVDVEAGRREGDCMLVVRACRGRGWGWRR
jgi:hypothetical protein